MHRIKTWFSLVKNPIVVVYVLALILVLANLYIAQRTAPYTSDGVSWQNILRTWTPLNRHIVDMGIKDNFLVNVPLLVLLGHFFNPGRTLLFLEASIFCVVNFTLFYIASLYFLKRSNVIVTYVTLLPLVWVASLGYNFAHLFLNTDWRDFEMGVSFVYFMLAVKVYYGELEPFKSWLSRVMTVLIAGIAGIFIYSDPYFLYLTILPVVLLFVGLFLLKKVPKKQVFLVIGSFIFSMIAARATKTLAAHAGLFTPQGTTVSVVPLNHVPGEVTTSLNELTTIFGANTSGDHLASLPAIAALLNLTLVIVMTIWLVVVVVKLYNNRKQLVLASHKLQPVTLLPAFFGTLYALVFIANVIDIEDDYRYFVLSIYLISILAALCIGVMRQGNRLLLTIVGLTICADILTSIFAYTPIQKADMTNNRANTANYEVIHTVQRLGLTKGYAPYWDGNINSYLSTGNVNFLPLTCIDGNVKPLKLLVDTTLFTQAANRTFYLADPSQTAAFPCSEQDIEQQFGKPQEAIRVQDKTIMVYDYDLVSKLQR